VLVIGASIGDKANIFAMVSDSLVNSGTLNAVAIIKEIAGEIKGGGGGQPFLASAGGKNPSGLPAALSKAAAYLKSITS
jgi:alanyl-tRNA synthetase